MEVLSNTPIQAPIYISYLNPYLLSEPLPPIWAPTSYLNPYLLSGPLPQPHTLFYQILLPFGTLPHPPPRSPPRSLPHPPRASLPLLSLRWGGTTRPSRTWRNRCASSLATDTPWATAGCSCTRSGGTALRMQDIAQPPLLSPPVSIQSPGIPPSLYPDPSAYPLTHLTCIPPNARTLIPHLSACVF